MKKKLLSLALACGMVFSLAACTNDGAAPATNSPVANTESSAPESQTPSYETASVRVAYMPNMGSGSTLVTAQGLLSPESRNAHMPFGRKQCSIR